MKIHIFALSLILFSLGSTSGQLRGKPKECSVTEDCPQVRCAEDAKACSQLTCNAGGRCVPAPKAEKESAEPEDPVEEDKPLATEEPLEKEPKIETGAPSVVEDPLFPPKCRDATECPNKDYSCEEGLCVLAETPVPSPEYYKCNMDSDCPNKEYECKDGKCAIIAEERLCGPSVCPTDQVCCNASCGVCTEPGMFCTQEACDFSYTKCSTNSDCPNEDDVCDKDGECVTVLEPVLEKSRECYEDINCPQVACITSPCPQYVCVDYACVLEDTETTTTTDGEK